MIQGKGIDHGQEITHGKVTEEEPEYAKGKKRIFLSECGSQRNQQEYGQERGEYLRVEETGENRPGFFRVQPDRQKDYNQAAAKHRKKGIEPERKILGEYIRAVVEIQGVIKIKQS